ncbi:type VI secretion system baseplate subunit TssE [Paludisphaera mucosa]|uniref:Type VI secretion system baseplate subunit TssE n=1 Tax=Paludisphaera mucosa TaxID=3030827 RepID=A0ABT6FDY7_9BACT|nr:type VI secretion system baseplate subunit TssE [Paludisphaera mucosa]MDG3005787.1 type VI secretion system baseplate subunit TssE [Paludisphaera mucosa]
MAKIPAAPRFPHSLWDRLTNPDLLVGESSDATATSRLDRLRREVLAHVEWILNARCCVGAAIEGSEILRSSLVGYGLPDISGLRTGDPRDRGQLERMIEDVIRRFEPRLKDVRVEFNAAARDAASTTLNYRVSAVIKVKPIAQPILFDTVLELGGRAFQVRGPG